jgi:hypothetical protein
MALTVVLENKSVNNDTPNRCSHSHMSHRKVDMTYNKMVQVTDVSTLSTLL